MPGKVVDDGIHCRSVQDSRQDNAHKTKSPLVCQSRTFIKLHNIPAGLLITDQRQQRLELGGGGENDEVLGVRRVRGRTSSGKGRGVEHRGNLTEGLVEVCCGNTS